MQQLVSVADGAILLKFSLETDKDILKKFQYLYRGQYVEVFHKNLNFNPGLFGLIGRQLSTLTTCTRLLLNRDKLKDEGNKLWNELENRYGKNKTQTIFGYTKR